MLIIRFFVAFKDRASLVTRFRLPKSPLGPYIPRMLWRTPAGDRSPRAALSFITPCLPTNREKLPSPGWHLESKHDFQGIV